MLPDWKFDGDDKKRVSFIAWVNAELDRFAVLTTDRFVVDSEPPDGWLDAARAASMAPRVVGRPEEGDARRALSGMDAALWDYMLIRYMFRRYWPKMRRSINDPANAAQIAARRNASALKGILVERDDRSPRDLAGEIDIAWRRWDDVPGRRMADADIAFLESQPAYLFAR